ncbi:MAG TPA: hypothetical protein VNK26_05290, partial [Pyrinomonadaceae bacterium]|nr:hypothetical protein [Pyrinomonadaceae bacterium]
MGQAAASVSIIGFKQENVSNQLELEKQFAAGINREEMIEWHKRLSEKPNHIGSPHNREMADYLAALFKEWGF